MMRLAAPCRALRAAAPCLAARARLPQRRLLSTGGEEEDDEDELFEFGSALHSFDVMRTSMAQRPNMEHTALFLCDMQEKFRSPVIHEFDAAVDTSRLLLQAAAAMDMPVRPPPQPPRSSPKQQADGAPRGRADPGGSDGAVPARSRPHRP